MGYFKKILFSHSSNDIKSVLLLSNYISNSQKGTELNINLRQKKQENKKNAI